MAKLSESDVRGQARPKALAALDRRTALIIYRRRVEHARQERERQIRQLAQAEQRLDAEIAVLGERLARSAAEDDALVREGWAIDAARARLDAARTQRIGERQRVEEEARALDEERRALEARSREHADAVERVHAQTEKQQQSRARLEAVRREGARERARIEDALAAERAERCRQIDALRQRYAEKSRDEATARLRSRFPRATGVLERANALEVERPPDGEPLRRSERFVVSAAARIEGITPTRIGAARDLSMTGASIELDPEEQGGVEPGAEVRVLVFAADDVDNQVKLTGRVVRRQSDLLAIDWSNDVEATFKMALLIESLKPVARAS